MKFNLVPVFLFILTCTGLVLSQDLSCTFDGALEDNPRCGWSNDLSDDFDWTLTRFPTPTPFTGPSGDHTTGMGNYLYTEANGESAGRTARIYSPADVPGNAEDSTITVLTFWYSMWESFPVGQPNMGTLNVYLEYGGGKVPTRPPVWSRSGPHTGEELWREARIMFRAAEPFRVIFEGVIGNGERSDIGIDDVTILTTDIPLSCDFESSPLGDLCMFYQEDVSDDFDWTRLSGETPSLDTGPLNDHTTNTGHYMYIEGNRQNVPARAQLTSFPYFKLSGSCSVDFWYHAYGVDIGQLRVLITHDAGNVTETLVDGVSENAWNSGSVDVPSDQGYYSLTFEGIRGDGNLGDIAIDDVQLMGQRCSDVDYCLSAPCLNGGVCNAQLSDYECTCAPGWEGLNCQENVDDCLSNNCPSGFDCIDLDNGFDCVCPPGFYGTNCQEATNTEPIPIGPIDTTVDGVDPETIPVIIGSTIGAFILVVTAAWFTATCIKQDGYKRKVADNHAAEEGGGDGGNIYVNDAYSPDDDVKDAAKTADNNENVIETKPSESGVKTTVEEEKERDSEEDKKPEVQ